MGYLSVFSTLPVSRGIYANADNPDSREHVISALVIRRLFFLYRNFTAIIFYYVRFSVDSVLISEQENLIKFFLKRSRKYLFLNCFGIQFLLLKFNVLQFKLDV